MCGGISPLMLMTLNRELVEALARALEEPDEIFVYAEQPSNLDGKNWLHAVSHNHWARFTLDWKVYQDW